MLRRWCSVRTACWLTQKPGLLLVDCSSIRPDTSKKVAEAARGARRCGALDAPVSGGEQGAIDATLVDHGRRRRGRFRSRQAGARHARQDDRPRWGPWRRPDGEGGQSAHRRRHHRAGRGRRSCSSRPTASTWKPPCGVLSGGLAGKRHPRAQGGQGCSSANSSPASGLTCTTRDLGIVQAAAREAGVCIPLGAVVSQLVAAPCRARGDGALDHSALLKLNEDLSGRSAPLTTKTGAPTHASNDCRARRGSRSSSGKERSTPSGCPAAAINPFLSRDARKSGGIDHVLARHVEGASHMAEGYTRAKAGNIGVCVGTSGPAGTDMITGLYSAAADSIPILCITGQAPVRTTAQGGLPGPSTSPRSPSR